MINRELDFEQWFSHLSNLVLAKCGIQFRDMDSVRLDYDEGKHCEDVADEIAAEYDDNSNELE